MKEKIVEYGAIHEVVIDSADEKAIICHAPAINEGFVLLYHGMKNLPKPGENGKIIFVRNSKRGHWQYYPNNLNP